MTMYQFHTLHIWCSLVPCWFWFIPDQCLSPSPVNQTNFTISSVVSSMCVQPTRWSRLRPELRPVASGGASGGSSEWRSGVSLSPAGGSARLLRHLSNTPTICSSPQISTKTSCLSSINSISLSSICKTAERDTHFLCVQK